MKKSSLIVVIIILIATNILTICQSYKHYEAASLLGDFAHIMFDKDSENEELFYETYTDIENCNVKFLKSVQELNEYCWMY